MAMHNLEDLLAQIGNANRFQALMIFFAKMPVALVSWTMKEMSFVKAEPKWCCVPTHINETAEEFCDSSNATFGKECPANISTCSHRVYEGEMETMINEWDLVCDDKWKANLSISLQMAGVLLGALVTGILADHLGRKKTFFVSITSLIIFSLIEGFVQSLEVFMVFRVLLGISCGIYLVVSIPYMMEFLSPSKRELPAVLPLFSIGGVLMTLVAWQLGNWRWLHWLCAAFMVPLLSSWFFLPESLRWLTVKGKLDNAEKVVAYIARVNRRAVPHDCRKVLELVYEQERKLKESGKKSYSYLDIYRGWHLFKTSVIFQFLWFSLSFLTYGILFGASTLGLSLYLNLFLLTIISLPMSLMLLVLMPRFGRKTIIIGQMILSTLAGFGALVAHVKISETDERDLITNVFCLVSVTFLGGAWAAVVVLNNESYPTVLRSLGYGAANTVARVGGILAPFAFDFETMATASYAFIGGVLTLCTLLVTFLKETHGKDLPDTLHEAQIAKDLKDEKGDNHDEGELLIGVEAEKEERKYGAIGPTRSKSFSKEVKL